MTDELREALESAYEAEEKNLEEGGSDGDSESVDGDSGGKSSTDTSGNSGDNSQQDHGKYEGNEGDKGDGDKIDSPTPENGLKKSSDDKSGDDGFGDRDSDKPSTPPDDGLKPPIGWDPSTREEWGKLPASVRKAVANREAEVNKVLQNTAEARRTQEYMGRVTSTFGGVMAAEGYKSPAEAIEGVLQTVSQLRLGTAAQKATILADLVGRYGVDIGMLDEALAGSAPSGDPTSLNFEKMLDERLAPITQTLQGFSNSQQTQMQVARDKSASDLEEFSKTAEFLQDVRFDMADIIDLATKRGQQLTIQQAYDKACALNPQVSAVMAKRAEAKKLADAQKDIDAKKNASSSINGKPSGDSDSKPKNLSLHDEISNIWDQATGG